MTAPEKADTTELVTGLTGLATQLRRMVDGASFVRDGYVRVLDPGYLVMRIEQASSQITQLTEERDRLREALKPFATAAQEIDPAVPDDAVAMNWGGQRPILMSDLRRAAALALPSIPEKPE